MERQERGGKTGPRSAGHHLAGLAGVQHRLHHEKPCRRRHVAGLPQRFALGIETAPSQAQGAFDRLDNLGSTGVADEPVDLAGFKVGRVQSAGRGIGKCLGRSWPRRTGHTT